MSAEMRGDGLTTEERPVRRMFTLAYKRQIVAEYEAAPKGGPRGAILRREGLSSTHVTEWRTANSLGELSPARAESERVRRTDRKEQAAENQRLRTENERLTRRLEQSQAALDIMGKAHALLAALAESAELENQPKEP